MAAKDIISVVAPWIGTLIGGPLGGLAVEAAASALGLSDKTAESVKAAISGASPEQLLALKKADQDFSVKMQELGFKNIADLETIAASDRKDARDMQKTTKSKVPAVLSLSVTLGYFTTLIGMMSGKLTVSDSQALLIMLGSLGTSWGMVMAYWFGTTSNSTTKTELIANSVPIKEQK